MKNDKSNFLPGSEGNKGGEGWEMYHNAFLMFTKQIFFDTSFFVILELILLLKFQK